MVDPGAIERAPVAASGVPKVRMRGVRKAFGDEPGGGVLLAAQLRIAVDVPPPFDEFLGVRGEPRSGGLREAHSWAPPRLRSCKAMTRSRAPGVCASLTTVRASMIAPSTTARSPLGPAAAAAKSR